MNSTEKNSLEKPTLLQTIGAVLVAAIMWGSGNVLSRSLLIEGVNEIFLVTLRVTLIGSILFLNYFLFIREKFQMRIFKEATITGTFSVFSVSWFYSIQSAIKIFVSLVPPLFLFEENTIFLPSLEKTGNESNVLSKEICSKFSPFVSII